MKKIMLLVLTVLLVSAFLMGVGKVLKVVNFSVVNDSKFPVGIKMEYVENIDHPMQPSGELYIDSIPPNGEVYKYSALKTDYYFSWWSGDGVCLKPIMELTYDKPNDSLMLAPLFSTILRFKQ